MTLAKPYRPRVSRRHALLLGLVVAAASHATAATSAAQPLTKGDCRWVHGRFAVYNGHSVQRIWIVGSKHTVAIPDDDSDVPKVIRDYEAQGPFLRVEDALFADFRVCALEDERPGNMQHVGVSDVRNPIFRGKPFKGASDR